MPRAKKTTTKKTTTRKTADKKPPTKKRGRPRGVKTEKTAPVIVLPPACKKCQSTDINVTSTFKTMKHTGMHFGIPYNKIVWRYTLCNACGQRGSQQVFSND